MSKIRDFFNDTEFSFSEYLPGMILMIPFLPSNMVVEMPGFHLCDGTEFAVTTYGDLHAVIDYDYGSTDGAGGVGSSHFRVPDYRGLFFRGVDDGTGYDPDIILRTLNTNVTAGAVGSMQDEQILSHTHGFWNDSNLAGGAWSADDANTQTSAKRNTTASGGDETRPKNFSMVFVIKY